MSIADDLAELGKEPTAAQVVRIFNDNDLPLKSRGHSVVVPHGITPQMAEMIHRHEAGIVSALHPAKKEKDDDDADSLGSQPQAVSGRAQKRRTEAE